MTPQKIALITGSTDGLGRAVAVKRSAGPRAAGGSQRPSRRPRSASVVNRRGPADQAQAGPAAAAGERRAKTTLVDRRRAEPGRRPGSSDGQQKPTTTFDREYYRRYYYDPRTAVTTRREMQARARLIAAFTEHVGLPVRRLLDAGCGTGLLRTSLKRLLPKAEYVCLETSAYLCSRYGWEHGRIEEFRSTAAFDLVICYDVLQYLDSAAAARALTNFGRLSRGVLYFSALTRRDWQWNCDPVRTDSNVHLRAAQWYRLRLQRNFREIGAGFWLRRGAPLAVWELESQF